MSIAEGVAMVSISAVASMIAIKTKLLCLSQVTSAWVLSADLIKPPPPGSPPDTGSHQTAFTDVNAACVCFTG